MFARSCRASAELKQAKKDYSELKRITEADHELMSIRVDELNKAIGHRDETIGQLERKVTQYVEKTTTLTAELTALQNAEPQTTPEIESMPIVISLRGQVAKLTEMFSLSQATVAAQRAEIAEYVGQVKDLRQLSEEWKGAYEREHKLRVQAEGLFKICERSRKLNKFWRTTSIVATGAMAGLLLLK
jgi:chromosome segregation ATPase